MYCHQTCSVLNKRYEEFAEMLQSERLLAALLAYSQRLLRRRRDLDAYPMELLNDSVLKVCQSHNYDDIRQLTPKCLYSYLRRSILRNFVGALRRHKAWSKRRVFPPRLGYVSDSIEQTADSTIWSAALSHVTDGTDRIILLWRVRDSLPYGQIASRLGISPACARQRYNRSIRMLRARLHDTTHLAAAPSQPFPN